MRGKFKLPDVVLCVLSMHKVLGSTSSTKIKEEEEEEEEEKEEEEEGLRMWPSIVVSGRVPY